MSDRHFVHTQPRKMTPQSAWRGTSTPVTSGCTLTFRPASGSVSTSGLSLFGPRVGRLLLFWTQETLERHVGLGGRAMPPLQAAPDNPNLPVLYPPLSTSSLRNATKGRLRSQKKEKNYAGERSGSRSTIAGFGRRKSVL